MDQHKLQIDTPVLPSEEVSLQNLTHSQEVKDPSRPQTFQNNVEQQNTETRTGLVKHDVIVKSDQKSFETLEIDRAKRGLIEDDPRLTTVNLREQPKSLAGRPQSLQCETDLKRIEPRLHRWASEEDSLTRQHSKKTTRSLSLSKLEEFDCTNRINETSRTVKDDTGYFEVVHSKAPIASKLTRGYSGQSVHTSCPAIDKFVRSVATTGRVDPVEWYRLERSHLLSASCSNIPEADEHSHPNTAAYSESNIRTLNDPSEDMTETNPMVSVSVTNKKYRDIEIKDSKNCKQISQDCDISTVLYEVFETIMSNYPDKSINERIRSSVENIDELSKSQDNILLKFQPDCERDVANKVDYDSSEVVDDVTNNDVATNGSDYCNFSQKLSRNVKDLKNNCSADILREVIDLVQTALPDVSHTSMKREDSLNQKSPSTPELFAALKWLLHKIPDEEEIETDNNVLNYLGKPLPVTIIDNDNNSNEVFDDSKMYTSSNDYPIIISSIDCDKKINDHFKTDKENVYDETFWDQQLYVSERTGVSDSTQESLDSPEQNFGIRNSIEQKYEGHNSRVVHTDDSVLMNKNFDVECHTNDKDDQLITKTLDSQENTIHSNDYCRLRTSANLIENCDPNILITNPGNFDGSHLLKTKNTEQKFPTTTQYDFVDNSVNVFRENSNEITEAPRDVLTPGIQPVENTIIHSNTCHRSDAADDVISVVIEADADENDVNDVTRSNSNSILDQNDTHPKYQDRHSNDQGTSFHEGKTNNCETFWDQQPFDPETSGVKLLTQEPLDLQKQIIRKRINPKQEYENNNYNRTIDKNEDILMSENLFDYNMASQVGHDYSSNQYYRRSQAGHDYQPLEKCVSNPHKYDLNTRSVHNFFDSESTLEKATSISSGSQTNEINESSDPHSYDTTIRTRTPNSLYVMIEPQRHQSHSTFSHTLRGSLSDSSSMTSETSVRTDGTTQTESCPATVDYDYEIEKLRAERQRICDILTRCDYTHSRERVQAAEARLNYGIGQMDTLLGYIELEPIRSARVRTDRVVRESSLKDSTGHMRTTTATITTTSSRRSSNNIVQNQNNYFKRLGLPSHPNGGSKPSANAKLVLGFDRSRDHRDLRSSNIIERGRRELPERYSEALRISNSGMTSFQPSNPVVTSFHSSIPGMTLFHSLYPVVTATSFQQNDVSVISRKNY